MGCVGSKKGLQLASSILDLAKDKTDDLEVLERALGQLHSLRDGMSPHQREEMKRLDEAYFQLKQKDNLSINIVKSSIKVLQSPDSLKAVAESAASAVADIVVKEAEKMPASPRGVEKEVEVLVDKVSEEVVKDVEEVSQE